MILPQALATPRSPTLWSDKQLQTDISRYITRQAGALSPDVFASILDRTHPSRLPAVLWHASKRHCITGQTLAQHLGMAFAHCARPAELLPQQHWLTLFKRAGFTQDGQVAKPPATPARLWRAAHPQHARRMSWTPSLDTAHGYAAGDGHAPGAGRIYTTLAEPHHVLAINDRNLANPIEVEWVLDPRHLHITEETPA
ncbi:hypothetical protein [Streptomyces sp. NPDC006552]|uniref:hypothetical protein n=1 Tax=Streptomyces sp. NPDC006552 TaxID=3157179 RepID=UPI0033AED0F0